MTLSVLGNGQIFGRRHGNGPPTVLALHGWARTHADFDTSLQGLDALALDLPGFGATPVPESAWGASQYATAVGVVLEEMDQPVVVVGHSFGGRVAVHLAQQEHEAVSGLVLTGVPLLRRTGRPPRSPLQFRFAKQLHKLGLISDTRVDHFRDRYGSSDYRNASGVLRDILVTAVNETYEDQLNDITCAVELLWGSNDTAVPVEVAQRAQELLTDAHLTVTADADHFLPVSRPDLLRAAIDRKLQERTT